MTTEQLNVPSSLETPLPSRLLFIVFPVLAVMLGWAWRGFIGGGPFAAMIPGAFIALSLSLLLRHDRHEAAVAALFGAIGLGCGGEMTYGQTLGLACDPNTMAWGLLGVALKGGIWGLLGGAILGAGLCRAQYSRGTLLMGLLLALLCFYPGWKLINASRLIYFSNPFDKPRDEVWAGLLGAAIAFIVWILYKGRGKQRAVPFFFALWGLVGGAIGFGAGCLFLIFGRSSYAPAAVIDWWKLMECFFGAMLGLVFGLAAWLHRDRLKTHGVAETKDGAGGWIAPVILLLFVIGFFVVFPKWEQCLEGCACLPGLAADDVLQVLYNFLFFGILCIGLALYCRSAAWHVAITVTFFHTVLDFNRNCENMLGWAAPLWMQLSILIVVVGIVAVCVHFLDKGPRPVSRLYLLLLWASFIMATLKTLMHHDYFKGTVNRFVPWHMPMTIIALYVLYVVTTAVLTFIILHLGKAEGRAARGASSC
ncbi:MAG: hypothetical protein GX117_04040 [Candidatus Hydrogenedentes bacterium]|jgi:hypothetical protein|nr:hypothetical protein [Candidatus Hydrogenedentota bacterium]